MIKYIEINTNCVLTPVTISNVKIEKKDINKFIIVAVKKIIAQEICENEKFNVPLQGTYLLELNKNCILNINNIDIKIYKDSEIKFVDIKLPKIKVKNVTIVNNDIQTEPLELDNINLDESKYLKNKFKILKDKIDTEKNNNI